MSFGGNNVAVVSIARVRLISFCNELLSVSSLVLKHMQEVSK